jgi:hypothetical protein
VFLYFLCVFTHPCRTEESIDTGSWLTEKQIMVENGYMDPESTEYQTAKSALLDGLESRPHEKESMAALNIKQYYLVKSRTENSTGSSKQDTFVQAHEVDEKTAARIAKSFDAGELQPQIVGGAPEPKVTLEPWKKDALELERKSASVQTRAGKAIQTAKSMMLKLGRLSENGNSLAGAHKDNLGSKVKVLEKALDDFQISLAGVDTKNPQRALDYSNVAVPAMAVLKDHCVNFEKVSRMANGYINMAE